MNSEVTLEQLRGLSERATPGEWKAEFGNIYSRPSPGDRCVDVCEIEGTWLSDADASLVVACVNEIRRQLTTPPASGEVVGVQEISNLLAVIHGDGGHYQHDHGTAKAATDALAKYTAIQQRMAEAAPKQAMGWRPIESAPRDGTRVPNWQEILWYMDSYGFDEEVETLRDWLAADLPAAAQPLADAETVERVAMALYAQFPYQQSGEKPKWQERGNSDMQEYARKLARQALKPPAQPLAPADGEDVWAKVDANGGDERCVPNNAATPPAPAREAVACELAACPFCGKSSTAKVVEHKEDDSYTVVCDASTANRLGGCGGACGYERTPEKAAASWNRRAHPAAGAVVVDDQMVERAIRAYESAYFASSKDTHQSFRAALTAAIGGG